MFQHIIGIRVVDRFKNKTKEVSKHYTYCLRKIVYLTMRLRNHQPKYFPNTFATTRNFVSISQYIKLFDTIWQTSILIGSFQNNKCVGLQYQLNNFRTYMLRTQSLCSARQSLGFHQMYVNMKIIINIIFVKEVHLNNCQYNIAIKYSFYIHCSFTKHFPKGGVDVNVWEPLAQINQHHKNVTPFKHIYISV